MNTLADQILCYQGAHSPATDTQKVIACWWIKWRQRLEKTLVQVQSELDLLVIRSQIDIYQRPSGITSCLLHRKDPGAGEGA